MFYNICFLNFVNRLKINLKKNDLFFFLLLESSWKLLFDDESEVNRLILSLVDLQPEQKVPFIPGISYYMIHHSFNKKFIKILIGKEKERNKKFDQIY